MKEFKTLIGTRKATEADFRTSANTLKLNVEYYEYNHWAKSWKMDVTDEETDRQWLKAKIAMGRIEVPIVPALWNQKPMVDELRESA